MGDVFAGFQRASIGGVPVLWREDARFKTFQLGLSSRRPLDERAAARSLLPALMLRGTERDPSRPALARRMESLYGATVAPSSSKFGETSLFALALDAVAGSFLPGRPDQLGAGLDFLGDYLTHPRLDGVGFPAATFRRERDQAANAIRAMRDDKGRFALERALECACAGEPMAIPAHGGLDAVEALDRGDPEAARRDFLERGELLLLGMGPQPLAAVQPRLEAFLGGLPKRTPEPLTPPVAVAPRDAVRTVERTPLQQSKQVLVFRAPSVRDDIGAYVGRRLFSSMLGGGAHSRLFREVREKLSLAYYASAEFDAHKDLLIVQVGLDEQSAERAEAEIVAQVKRLAEGGGDYDDDELQTAKAGIMAGLDGIDDSVRSRCAFTLQRWVMDNDRTPAEQARLYLDATRDEVARGAAGIWLDHVYLLAPGEEAAA